MPSPCLITRTSFPVQSLSTPHEMSGSQCGSPGGSGSTTQDHGLTMHEVMSQDKALADQARLTFPGEVDSCTFYQGPLRQNVWSCRECDKKDHELVELWARRDFTCDCPTIPSRTLPTKTVCTLNGRHRAVDPPNAGNRYMRNFQNEFCRCSLGLTYDPLQETEGMICCLACEDWFHESCLDLRDRPPDASLETRASETATFAPVGSDPVGNAVSDQPAEAKADTTLVVEDKDGDDDDSDDDDEQGVRIPSSSYDALICAQCVKSNTVLKDLAGTPGWMLLASPAAAAEGTFPIPVRILEDGWRILGSHEPVEEPSAKRVKLADDACRKPPPNAYAQTLLDDPSYTKGDLFVSYGAREALCQCRTCKPLVDGLPFPLVDQEIYEPPRATTPEEDADAMTARLLETLPRSQAINAIMGFQPVKDGLDALFKQRSASGLPVTREDIEHVFDELKRKRKA